MLSSRMFVSVRPYILCVTRQLALTILGLVGVALINVDAAHAVTKTVTFCNRNALVVEVAWGFDHAQKGLTSAGWKRIPGCSCGQLFTEDLSATEIWLFVTKEGTFESLNDSHAQFCVRRAAFRFGTSSKSEAACRTGGSDRRWMSFQRVDVTTAPRINFRAQGQPACNID